MINAYNNEPRGQVSYRVDRAEVDRILDKINSQGFGALTDHEKKLLDAIESLDDVQEVYTTAVLGDGG